MIFPCDKEDVLIVKFNKELNNVVKVRIPSPKDKEKIALNKEKQTVTLWEDKAKYPYIVIEDVICTVFTTHRKFSFRIPVGYVWNGADIPWLCEMLVGSKQELDFLVPSMVHDFLLEHKKFIFKEVLSESMTVKEYRRLTSLIFRQLLKQYDVRVVKSNVMGWAVDVFQATINRKNWNM